MRSGERSGPAREKDDLVRRKFNAVGPVRDGKGYLIPPLERVRPVARGVRIWRSCGRTGAGVWGVRGKGDLTIRVESPVDFNRSLACRMYWRRRPSVAKPLVGFVAPEDMNRAAGFKESLDTRPALSGPFLMVPAKTTGGVPPILVVVSSRSRHPDICEDEVRALVFHDASEPFAPHDWTRWIYYLLNLCAGVSLADYEVYHGMQSEA